MRSIRILSLLLFLTLIGSQLSFLVLLENRSLAWISAFLASNSASLVLFYNLYFFHHKHFSAQKSTAYQIIYVQKPNIEEDFLYRKIKNRL